MYQKEKVNMKAFGLAVKEARERKGMSREKLAEILDLAPRYIMYVETRGQHMSLQKLYEVASLFHISIDQFFFADTSDSKSTLRRQLDAMLDGMDDRELHIIRGTAEAIKESKEIGK